MIKTTRCCDICGSELPTEEVKTSFGVVESTRTFKCKEWDVSSVMHDLCELCALKIDMAVIKLKEEYGGQKQGVPDYDSKNNL